MKALVIFSFLLFSLALFADESCIDCHDDVLDKPLKHEAAVLDCTFCHDPNHDTDTGEPYRLLEKGQDLCFQCHDNFTPGFPQYGRQSVGHPVSGHPTSGPKDPLYPKKEFSCISCHNPHSSKSPKLFRYDYSKDTAYKGLLCSTCHWKISNAGPTPPPPPWN